MSKKAGSEDCNILLHHEEFESGTVSLRYTRLSWISDGISVDTWVVCIIYFQTKTKLRYLVFMADCKLLYVNRGYF